MPSVLQINISNGGVPKTPIAQAEIGPLGITGDHHLYRGHGGPQQALLLMSAELIDQLRAEGFSVFYGALGENITTRGLDHTLWQPGLRFRLADVVIELTKPREPCRKLNPYGRGIQRRLLAEPGATGYYASVIAPGTLLPNAIIEPVVRVS